MSLTAEASELEIDAAIQLAVTRFPFAARTHPAAEALAQNRPQHADPVLDGAQVARSMQTLELDARHLHDLQLAARDSHVDQGLDLESVTGDMHRRQAVAPEGVVAVAQVRVPGSVENIDQQV